MAKLVWDNTSEHFYETGVDHAVLYPMASTGVYGVGVAWNGITSITESPSGADSNPFYADNIKYLDIRSAEDFGATIECYTYPEEFEECNGRRTPTNGLVIGQQPRKGFGLSYRTIVGNDTEYNDHGYKLHLIYNATASPAELSYQTVNDSPEPGSMSFEMTTTPVPIPGFKNTALITIDSTKVAADKLAALETLLYGDASTNPTLPSPETVLTTLGLTYNESTKTWAA